MLEEIDNRMAVIVAIDKLTGHPATDELHALHPLITQARWLSVPNSIAMILRRTSPFAPPPARFLLNVLMWLPSLNLIVVQSFELAVGMRRESVDFHSSGSLWFFLPHQ